MVAKLNNSRLHPDANHQPMHKAKFRADEAKERQAAYDDLTIQQKLDLLDRRLGAGLGAVKQRARLLREQSKPKVQETKKDVTPTQNGEETKAQKEPKDQQKKYMKGSK